ncbi:hypothetical protein J6590_064512 [Homalodisca vitripennis]|nr:hypothetical protein J6590_064512 [Homalodisca vitripennis]
MNNVKSAVFQKSITDHYSCTALTIAATITITTKATALATCVNIGHNLASGKPLVRDSDLEFNTDFVFHTVTEHDLARYLTGMRVGSAPGRDGVWGLMLKQNT